MKILSGESEVPEKEGQVDPRHDPRHWKLIASITIALFAVLLFARLGHYSLWDDEAMVGLIAKGVMKTGDTSALMEHGNVMAYREGLLLHNLHDRSTPPLATYLTAASFSLFGVNAWSARLPFALLGVATCALLLYWARKASPLFLVLFSIGILCNVSLILYFRQCRYYAPSIFFSVAIAYLYSNWNGNRRRLLLLAACSVLLFASNYLVCIILYSCLFVDYLVWKRHEHALKLADLGVLFLPQIVFCGLLALIWNPFKTGYGGYTKLNTFGEKLTLFNWFIRDLNACEFAALSLLLLGGLVGISRRQPSVMRGLIALILFVFAMAFLAPQDVSASINADVRYVAPIMPLGIAISAAAICSLLGRWPIVAVSFGCLVFGSTVFHGAPLGVRSTIAMYLRELADPPDEPFGPTADWINQNIPANSSVLVVPEYARYPLMFHAPKVTYAWQLAKPEGQFKSFPPIHFIKKTAPDYLIGFGPWTAGLMDLKVESGSKGDYELVAGIRVYWKDLYRPELFWRTFIPLPEFDPNNNAVYIFKRNR